MTQHDGNLANQDGASYRADNNVALQALFEHSSGATAPSTTFQFQFWADTTTGLMKIRNSANSAWIVLFVLATGAPAKGADIVSANALPVLADGVYNDITTGVDTVTSINTLGVGALKILHTDVPILFTHHSTNLVLPAGNNIQTIAGQILTFYEYAAADWRLVGNSLPSIGKHTIAIPAAAFVPTESNGAEAITSTETTAGRPDIRGFAFDDAADEAIQFHFPMPKSWNLGTLTFQVQWTSLTGADTDGVAWALEMVHVPDNSTIDVVYGTAIVVTDDLQGAAEEQLETAESAALTVGGTPAVGGMVYGRLFRDTSDGNDDMEEDAVAQSIKLNITTNALEDS